MNAIGFSTTTDPAIFQSILLSNDNHQHIHHADMPYRLSSTWQDRGCEFGLWRQEGSIVGWGVFQPPWWNFDYGLRLDFCGTELEKELFSWAKAQMITYSQRADEWFWGSVELFESRPNLDKTLQNFRTVGFTQFDWSTLRFSLDLAHALPKAKLPDGFSIRPISGPSEAQAYVDLHRAAFNSDKMTRPWRLRTMDHVDYRPKLDLLAIDPDGKPAGFCIGWLKDGAGQIEPLGVHPDYQGIGLGRALELTTLNQMQQLGAQKAVVDHVSLNEAAIKLSLQNGFKQTDNALRFYIDTSEAQP